MKTIAIELTAREIEVLQICLCSQRMILEDRVAILANHNKTGINTKVIENKRKCMNECDRLFDKLYEAEQQI